MKSILLSVIPIIAVCAWSANAEDATGSKIVRSVDGIGVVSIKQVPTVMRMTIQFKETGKDLTEALSILKTKRDAAKAQLIKLGAKEDSILQGPATLLGEDAQGGRMSVRAMMMAARGGNSKKKKKAVATKVSVGGSLRCEWALPSGSPEDLLEFVLSTKEKISAADLTGQKEQKKLSAEEQEELEELEMMQREMGENPSAIPGEPAFVFLAKVSPDDQQKAQTAAFQKARAQAEKLVMAAGAKLGKLHTLQSNQHATSAIQMMAYRQYGMGGDEQSDDDTSEESEEIGKSATCTAIKFTFSVQATFEINE